MPQQNPWERDYAQPVLRGMEGLGPEPKVALGPRADAAPGAPKANPWERDYAPAAAPVKHPMPEPPGAPKIAALQPGAPAPPGTATRVGKAFWEGIGGKLMMDLMGGASRDPERARIARETAKGLAQSVAAEPGRVWGELSHLGQAMVNLDPKAILYRTGTAVPFLGAQAQQASEEFERGDIEAGTGHALALAAPLVTKGVQGTAAAIRRGPLPTAAKGAVKGGYKAATSPKTVGESALAFTIGQVAGPKAGAATSAALTGTRIAIGAGRGAREALKARAAAAAKSLAEETAANQARAAEAVQPGMIPVDRQLPPGARRIDQPASFIRSVPGEYAVREPLPPSRQLAAPGRPAIITPAPDPLAGDTSGVRSVPAVYGTSATNEAAVGMREAMDLQPGQFAPPAGRTSVPTVRASQIDAMARHMRDAGITAADAILLDPPELAALAKNAGVEGPLKTTLDKVRKRLAAMEKAEAETAKIQAALDRLKPAERQVTESYRGEGSRFTRADEPPAVERKPPASASVAEPDVTTPPAFADPWKTKIESEPGYVYHGTSAERLMDIADSGGLKLFGPSWGTPDQAMWPDQSTAKRAYFSKSADAVRHFLPEGKPVVLRVREEQAGYKKSPFTAEQGTGDIVSHRRIPASRIEVLTDKGWKPIRSVTKSQDVAPVTTAEQANVELGKQYPAPATVEGPAAPTASQRRVQGMAAILAEGELSAEQLRGGLKTDIRARLFLENESQRLGYGKIAAGELDKIIAEIERLRSEAPASKAK